MSVSDASHDLPNAALQPITNYFAGKDEIHGTPSRENMGSNVSGPGEVAKGAEVGDAEDTRFSFHPDSNSHHNMLEPFPYHQHTMATTDLIVQSEGSITDATDPPFLNEAKDLSFDKEGRVSGISSIHSEVRPETDAPSAVEVVLTPDPNRLDFPGPSLVVEAEAEREPTFTTKEGDDPIEECSILDVQKYKFSGIAENLSNILETLPPEVAVPSTLDHKTDVLGPETSAMEPATSFVKLGCLTSLADKPEPDSSPFQAAFGDFSKEHVSGFSSANNPLVALSTGTATTGQESWHVAMFDEPTSASLPTDANFVYELSKDPNPAIPVKPVDESDAYAEESSLTNVQILTSVPVSTSGEVDDLLLASGTTPTPDRNLTELNPLEASNPELVLAAAEPPLQDERCVAVDADASAFTISNAVMATSTTDASLGSFPLELERDAHTSSEEAPLVVGEVPEVQCSDVVGIDAESHAAETLRVYDEPTTNTMKDGKDVSVEFETGVAVRRYSLSPQPEARSVEPGSASADTKPVSIESTPSIQCTRIGIPEETDRFLDMHEKENTGLVTGLATEPSAGTEESKDVTDTVLHVSEIESQESAADATSTLTSMEDFAEATSSHPEIDPMEGQIMGAIDQTLRFFPNDEDDTLLPTNDVEADHPVSPWTPSYSVTTQGPGLCGDHHGNTALELPPAATESELESVINAPVIQLTKTMHPSEQDVELVEESLSSSSEPQAADAEPSPHLTSAMDTAEETNVGRPKSPWTPSYSVTTQGSPLLATAELDHVDVTPYTPADQIELDTVTDVGGTTEILSTATTDDEDETADLGPSHSGNQYQVVPETTFHEPIADIFHLSTEDSNALTTPMFGIEDTAIEGSGMRDTSPSQDSRELRPSSPWTPSYSMITQGTLPLDTEEFDQSEGIPQKTHVGEIHGDASVEQSNSTEQLAYSMKRPEHIIGSDADTLRIPGQQGIAMPEIASATTPMDAPVVEPTEPEDLEDRPTMQQDLSVSPLAGLRSDNVQLGTDTPRSRTPTEETNEKRPKSPWAPSYSVTTQGSPLLNTTDVSRLEPLPVSAPSDEPLSPDGLQLPLPVAETETRPQGLVVVSNVPLHGLPAEINLCGDAVDLAGRPVPQVNVETTAQMIPSVVLGEGHVGTMSMGQEESASPSILLSDKESIGERPKSPWTPSYSVTVQGPGLTEDQPADGLEHIPDCALINNPQEVSSAPAILLSVPDENPVVASDSDSELPVAGLAPEVSMTTQTASGIVTPKSDGVATWSVECTDPIFVSDGQLAVANSVDLPELSQYDNETTHQATPPAAQSVLAPIEVVAESDEPSADSLNSDRTDLSSLTNADPVNAGHLAMSDQAPSMEMTTPLEHLLPEAAMEVEAASSVTEMTPSLVAEDRPTISQPQAFPCNDTQGEEVVSKLNVARLSPVDENGDTDSTLGPLDATPSPTVTRTRLESTASSRFFPGGWFSSSSKVQPQEGRASLDMAAGEFIPVRASDDKPPVDQLSSDRPSTEVPVSAADLSTSASPTAQSNENEEKKGRWCIVM